MTIKDIAKICNVGVSTVSRVINDHPDVSDEMRMRVRQVIEDNNYIPNNSARNLVLTNSDTIAIVVRGVSNPFFTRIIKGMEQEIRNRGYSITLHQIRSDDDEIKTAAILAKEKRLCGIMLLGGRFNYEDKDVAVLEVPYVCSSFTNYFGNLDKSEYSSIAIDDRKTAYDAVVRLYNHGHRQIAALISQPDDKSISELRYSGYRQALEDCNLNFDEKLVISAGGFGMEASYCGIINLVRSGAKFTALFSICDSMAIAAIKALDDSGINVPEDCSVIAIDGLELSQYTIPTLTTFEQPMDDIAYQSAKTLVDLIENKAENKHIVLSSSLREGGSLRRL